jgi:hypothetical protein
MQRLLLSLIMFICFTNTVLSQDLSSQQILSDCTGMYCYSVERLGANGNIFVYHEDVIDSTTSKRAIYEIDTITNAITEYNIDSFNPTHGHAFDFAVLNGYKVIFAEYWTDYRLTLVDLQTNSAIELSHDMSGLFVCGGITGGPFNRLRNIFLVDESHVLLCSRDGRAAYFNIARLENNSLMLEQHFRFGAYGEVAAYPASWRTVLSGLNGNAYVVSSTIYTQRSSGVEPLNYYEFAVEHYSPNSQTWSEQIVDLSVTRPELITDVNHRHIELIAVDELGNLYFLEDIRNRDYSHAASSLIKFTPNSQRVWELTEEDLGGIFESVIISDSNHATVFFEANSFLPLDLSTISESS